MSKMLDTLKNLITLDEILELSAEDIIGQISLRLYKQENFHIRDNEIFSSLPMVLRDIIFIIDLDTEITMEGILGFLENSTGLFLEDTILTIERIKANEDQSVMSCIRDILKKYNISTYDLRENVNKGNSYDISSFSKTHGSQAVLPINVSDRQLNRAYRIVDTILKAISQIKGKYSVDRSEKDNINISILGFGISFELSECKTKRRHLLSNVAINDFRPLYEDVFDGRLQIDWKISKHGYYHSDRDLYTSQSYADSDETPLEKQVTSMVFNIYKQCCDNEIRYFYERREQILRNEHEEEARIEREKAERLKKREAEKQARKNALVKDISEHATDWFKHEQLSKYADELDAHLCTFEDLEEVQLIKEYIRLVRENANKYNPLNRIIQVMITIESRDDD